jgi:hypothetical protein
MDRRSRVGVVSRYAFAESQTARGPSFRGATDWGAPTPCAVQRAMHATISIQSRHGRHARDTRHRIFVFITASSGEFEIVRESG